MPAPWITQFALVFSCQVLLRVAGEHLIECSDQTGFAGAPAGHQLLQVRRSHVALTTTVECTWGVGRDVPLDSDGFREVAESCCFDDMKDFIRRMSESLDMQVCNEGGLNGFAPHFSCSNETSFLSLKSAMQAAPDAKCPWLGLSDMECPPMDPSCGVTTNPLRRPSLLKGYFGLDAETNPPALVRNSAVRDKVKLLIADKLGVPEEAVVVAIGTGPVEPLSFYQVSMKSSRTGKYVETGPNGQLVASSTMLTAFQASDQQNNNAFELGGISANKNFLVQSLGSESVLVKWNKDSLCFQTENGEEVVEDEHGRVILSRTTDTSRRLQVNFLGKSLCVAALLQTQSRSSVTNQRSCTVTVSYEVLQTDPPTLDEEQVANSSKSLDVKELQTVIDREVTEIEPCLGHLEISAFKVCREKGTCDDKSLKPAHTDHDYEHVSNTSIHNDTEDVDNGSANETIESVNDSN